MKLRHYLWAALAVCFVGTMAAQGPLTPLFNIRGVTDSNGSLVLKSAAYTGPTGPLTILSNLRGKTDSNGYLMATIGAGTETPDIICLDSTNQDICFSRPATGQLKLYKDSTHGSVLDIATDSTVKFYDRLGTTLQWTFSPTALSGVSGLNIYSGNDIRTGNTGTLVFGGGGKTALYPGAGSGTDALLNIMPAAGGLGVQVNAGTAAPTVTSCGTGSVTAHSSNGAGEITATGATACTVTFGLPNWTNTPFCVVEDETSAVAQRISAISTTAFTVTALTSGDKFMYHCFGGV